MAAVNRCRLAGSTGQWRPSRVSPSPSSRRLPRALPTPISARGPSKTPGRHRRRRRRYHHRRRRHSEHHVLGVLDDRRAMELRVGNKYRLGRKIGSGSFGDIYLGELTRLSSAGTVRSGPSPSNGPTSP